MKAALTSAGSINLVASDFLFRELLLFTLKFATKFRELKIQHMTHIRDGTGLKELQKGEEVLGVAMRN